MKILNDGETREYLRQLEAAARQVLQPPQPVQKKLSDFAALAVPPDHGRPTPAAWTSDRAEQVRYASRGSAATAISAIARRCSGQPVACERRLSKRSGQVCEPLPASHALCQLLARPNPLQSFSEMVFQAVSWRAATGDSYIWKIRNRADKPVELWSVPPQWTKVLPSAEKYVGGYSVSGLFDKPRTIPAGDIVNWKNPSLDYSGSGRFYGASQLLACADAVTCEEKIYQRLRGDFANFAPPGMVFTTAAELSDDALLKAYQDIAAQFGSATQTGRPIISHSGFAVSEYSSTPREMGYVESLAACREAILAAFNVPLAAIGSLADSNRSNSETAQVMFAENVISPTLQSLGATLTAQLASEFDDGDLLIRFELPTARTAESWRDDLRLAADVGAVTANEIREHLLELPRYETGGDVPLVHSGQQPATFGNGDVEQAAGDDTTTLVDKYLSHRFGNGHTKLLSTST